MESSNGSFNDTPTGLAAELTHLIITNLSADEDLHTLTACSLVSRACLYSSRSVLFGEICLSDELRPFCPRARSRTKDDVHEAFRSLLSTSPELALFIKKLFLDAHCWPISNFAPVLDLPLLECMVNLEKLYIFNGRQTVPICQAVMESPQFPSLRQIFISSMELFWKHTLSHLPEPKHPFWVSRKFEPNDLTKLGLHFPHLRLEQIRFVADPLSQCQDKNGYGYQSNGRQRRWRPFGLKTGRIIKYISSPVEFSNERIEHLDLNTIIGV
jgi:hypothetical protein